MEGKDTLARAMARRMVTWAARGRGGSTGPRRQHGDGLPALPEVEDGVEVDDERAQLPRGRDRDLKGRGEVEIGVGARGAID